MKQLVWMALISVMSICAQQQQPPPLARGYVSQIASGGGWKTTLTLFNTTSAQTQVSVFFRADDGSPLSLPLVITQGGARQTGTASQVGLTIQPLATLVIESEAPAGSSTVNRLGRGAQSHAHPGFGYLPPARSRWADRGGDCSGRLRC